MSLIPPCQRQCTLGVTTPFRVKQVMHKCVCAQCRNYTAVKVTCIILVLDSSLDAVHTLNARILSVQSDCLDYMGATVKHNQSKMLKELLVQWAVIINESQAMDQYDPSALHLLYFFPHHLYRERCWLDVSSHPQQADNVILDGSVLAKSDWQ